MQWILYARYLRTIIARAILRRIKRSELDARSPVRCKTNVIGVLKTGLNINEALADRPTVLLRSWDSWRGQLGTEFERTRSMPARVYTGHALRATMLKSY